MNLEPGYTSIEEMLNAKLKNERKRNDILTSLLIEKNRRLMAYESAEDFKKLHSSIKPKGLFSWLFK